MIKAAIVGLGRWGRILVDSIHGQSEKIRFTVVVTRTPANAAAFASERCLTLSDDYQAVLRDPDIDAVVLATPHSMHAEQVEAAAVAGKHIFVEKPFTLTKQSAETAVRAAKDAGIVLAVGHNRRFLPSIAELRARLDAHALGMLMHVESNHSGDGGFRYRKGTWRASSAESPAGGMAGMGIHMVDAMIGLFGPIRQVHALSCRRVPEVEIDDTTAVLLQFNTGMTGYLGTLAATAPTWRIQVFGSKGWIELHDESRFESRALDADSEVTDFGPFNKERAELEAFADAIVDKAPYPVPTDQVIHGIAVFDAIVESANSGKTVEIC